jgi:transcription elongation GreA/GreB family factor
MFSFEAPVRPFEKRNPTLAAPEKQRIVLQPSAGYVGSTMNKTSILKALIKELEEELRRLLAANEAASAGATHAEARAETKWDTCGLEQSYLARGHAQQFETLAKQVEDLRAFAAPDFTGRAVDAGALVKVDMGGEALLFFLLHCGGGTELNVEGQEVTIITPESPVGAALLDKQPGETFSFRAGASGKVLTVT